VDRIAFAANGALFTIKVDGSDRRPLADGGQLPAWSPRGDRIAFLALPSAIAEGRATGAPYLDLHVVRPDGSGRMNLTQGLTGPGSILGFSWSPDGTKIVVAARGHLFVLAVDGTSRLQLTTESLGDLGSTATAAGSVAWSPDGRQIAVTNGNVFVIDADGRNLRQAGDDCGDAVAWSPASKQLAVACARTSLYVINTDGSGRIELTTGIDAFDRLQSFAWSPDGTRVIFDSQRPRELWVAHTDGSGFEVLPQGRMPSWSPDGSRIAFACPDEGWQLCVMSSGGRDKVQLTDAALGPIDSLSIAWSPAKQ